MLPLTFSMNYHFLQFKCLNEIQMGLRNWKTFREIIFLKVLTFFVKTLIDRDLKHAGHLIIAEL